MKKNLLLSLALTSVCSAFALAPQDQTSVKNFATMGPKAPAKVSSLTTRAEESYNFSYSYGLYSAYYLEGMKGGTSRVFMAFEMKPEDIKQFAGKKVTGFNVISPTNNNLTTNSVKDGRFFYSVDLTKEDYSQDFKLSTTPFAENAIAMDTPYTISGEEKSLYFGYSIVVPKNNNMYYYPIDGIASDYAGSNLCGIMDDGEGFPTEFESQARDMGALAMSIKIEGDDLPGYAWMYSAPSVCYIPFERDYSIVAIMAGINGSPIESIDIEYSLAGKQYSNKCELANPIPGGDVQTFSVNLDFPAQDEYLDEEVEFTISKINGIPNMSPNASFKSQVKVLKEVPVHQTLIEEFTSTGCPYCTRGYAALEYMKNNYPDFVTASYHTNYNNVDPMMVTSSFPVSVQGYPSASLDREGTCDPYYGNQLFNSKIPIVDEVLLKNSMFTPWGIKVSHTWDSDDMLTANVEAYNVFGYDKGTYKIAYILVADGLTGTGGGWTQKNGYSSTAQSTGVIEELNAFCRGGEYGKSSVVGLTFDDVVIYNEGFKGVNESVPSSLEPFESVEHSYTFDLTTVKSNLLPDKNKLRIIAAIVGKDGNVLNCTKEDVKDYTGAAVEGIYDENLPVEYFNLNGQKVSDPSNGIFIRRQGTKTDKVVIR